MTDQYQPVAPNSGRPIQKSALEQEGLARYLESTEAFRYDKNGKFAGGEFPAGPLMDCPALYTKHVPLGNKDPEDEYFSALQIEGLLLEALSNVPESTWENPELARRTILEFENARKLAYDLESRNKKAMERKLLQTSIVSSIQNTVTSLLEGKMPKKSKVKDFFDV